MQCFALQLTFEIKLAETVENVIFLKMNCYFAPRSLRSLNNDGCVGYVRRKESWSVGKIEEVSVCLKHERQLSKKNKENCGYPLKDDSSCKGALIQCPERLVKVFIILSEDHIGTNN